MHTGISFLSESEDVAVVEGLEIKGRTEKSNLMDTVESRKSAENKPDQYQSVLPCSCETPDVSCTSRWF